MRPWEKLMAGVCHGCKGVAHRWFNGPLDLGPQAHDPALHGRIEYAQVFVGGGQEQVAIVAGKALRPNGHYRRVGSLKIVGDVPAGVVIEVHGGRLIVDGDVGSASRLEATLPVLRARKEGTAQLPGDSDDAWEEKLLYPKDMAPAIAISGTTGVRVSLSANGGVSVAKAWPGLRIKTGNNRPALVGGKPFSQAVATVRRQIAQRLAL